MSNSSNVSIEYDFQPDTLRLIPEDRFQVGLVLHYSSDGVLDFEDLLGQLLAGIEAKIGKIKTVSQEGRADLKMQLAQNVIQHAIHPIPDILEDFDSDGNPTWDADGRLHLPLVMKGSGRKLDLVPRVDAGGELDADALIADLEESYRGVMSEVI